MPLLTTVLFSKQRFYSAAQISGSLYIHIDSLGSKRDLKLVRQKFQPKNENYKKNR
jgi:hypothetical protein